MVLLFCVNQENIWFEQEIKKQQITAQTKMLNYNDEIPVHICDLLLIPNIYMILFLEKNIKKKINNDNHCILYPGDSIFY